MAAKLELTSFSGCLLRHCWSLDMHALTKQLDHAHNHVHIPVPDTFSLSITKEASHHPWYTLNFALERYHTHINLHTVTDMTATVEWNHPPVCRPQASGISASGFRGEPRESCGEILTPIS